ncbi:LiaI-LiaF-like domain-containing protein [Natronincola ferrireducens]|uniref:LiaI-LiaF-like transmembrane region domain-containing protein n=1 Tax=Natronincola ferrireducens TaxID=393762 RepID=A0A1G8ZW78_9FIRM|nr:DUF5668 domain-containing protein [Natronincola ferrireducens]SDK19338.1 hypothetical protein SAMN05660472_00986 [Natronincola ferrireducens]
MITINIEKLTDGILLIGIGLLFLLSNLGIINWSIFGVLFRIWPLFLVVAGINIIFKNRPIVTLITWILFFAIFLSYGFVFQERHEIRNIGNYEEVIIEKYEETTKGKINLKFGGAKVDINGNDRHLVDACINPALIRSDFRFKDDKKEVIVDFDATGNVVHHIGSSSEHYSLQFHEDVVWTIAGSVGAVAGDFDLSDLKIAALDLDIGAGHIKLTLGTEYEKSDIKISAGASNINVIVPKDAGVAIRLEGLVSKGNVTALGWKKNGDYYYSPNYQEASSKLYLDVSMGVGNFNITVK